MAIFKTIRTLLISLGLLCSTWISPPCYGQEPETAMVWDIRNYGAKGDGITSDTRAIAATIDACVKKGGGTVYIPSGTFVTGTFQLFSNVNLYLSPGAVLLASRQMNDYRLQKEFGFSGYGAGNKLGLIFADHADNVSVTGTGTIDGRPDASIYMDSLQVSSPADWQYTRQGSRYMLGSSDTPAYDRKEAPLMWMGPYADRPGVELLFYFCRKVTIKDMTIRHAADWSMALVHCDDAKVLGISIHNNLSIPNSDGVDIYDSHNIVIADCDIRTGDDALAIISTNNLTVTNCQLESRSSGIRIGYNAFNDDNSGNLLFDNIRIYGSNRGIGIFQRRKGNMQNMLFTNMIIDTHLYPGQWWGHGEPIHISVLPALGNKVVGSVSHIRFENIIATGDEGIVIYGSADGTINDITFSQVQLTLTNGLLTASEGGNFDLRPAEDPALNIFSHNIPALYAQHVNGLTIRYLDMHRENGLPVFITGGLDCSNHVKGLDTSFISDVPVDRPSTTFPL